MKQTCTQDVIHWQKQSLGEICQLPSSGKPLIFLQQCAMNVISRSVMHCRNQGTDIAQLAESYPSAQRPSLEPFSAQVLEQAFKLQPGKFALTEVSLGWTY